MWGDSGEAEHGQGVAVLCTVRVVVGLPGQGAPKKKRRKKSDAPTYLPFFDIFLDLQI
jgi:hypothetical protein